MSILAIAANAATLSDRQQTSREERWCKPEPRQVKLNVDASFHYDSSAGSTGAILRDYQGNFVAAETTYLPHVASPMMAEAYAMRQGLILANRLGCNNVAAESDSLEIIQACTGEHSWWSEAAAIFADCMDLILQIGNVKFRFCLREANKVSHELAKNSFMNRNSCIWEAEAPNFIVSSLVNDVTIMDA